MPGDVSRFPEALLSVGSLLEAKPVGSLRVDEITGYLYRSISFPAVGWVLVDGTGPSPYSEATTAVSTTTAALGLVTVYHASATGITITVSTSDFAVEGRPFVFKDVSGSASAGIPITIATEGAQTIDGQASAQIIAPYGSLDLYVYGGNLLSK